MYGPVFLSILHRRPDEHADHGDGGQDDGGHDENDGDDAHVAVMFPSRADPSSEPFSAEDRAHVNIDLGSCAEPEFVNA